MSSALEKLNGGQMCSCSTKRP